MQFLIDGALIGRRLKCMKYAWDGTTYGCEDRRKGKCGQVPEELYKAASKWMCGYRAKWAYQRACGPNGEAYCKRWQTTRRRTSSERRRRVKTMRQRL